MHAGTVPPDSWRRTVRCRRSSSGASFRRRPALSLRVEGEIDPGRYQDDGVEGEPLPQLRHPPAHSAKACFESGSRSDRDAKAGGQFSQPVEKWMPIWPLHVAEDLPDLRVPVTLGFEEIRNPREIRAPRRIGLRHVIESLACRDRAMTVGMLPVSIPASARDEYRIFEKNLGVENHVLELAAETFLGAADAVDNLATDKHAAGAGQLVVDRDDDAQQVRRSYERVRRNGEPGWAIAVVSRFSRPTEPPKRAPVEHARLGVGLEQCHLLGEFVWFPHIVGIEKCDDLTLRVLDTEIARSAHSAVLVPRVF